MFFEHNFDAYLTLKIAKLFEQEGMKVPKSVLSSNILPLLIKFFLPTKKTYWTFLYN